MDKNVQTSPGDVKPEKIEVEYPFYIKAPIILIGLYLFFYIAFLLQEVLVPFAFAGLIAILLNPVYASLRARKLSNVAAIAVTVFGALLIIGLIVYLLSSQFTQFGERLPEIEAKLMSLLGSLKAWLTTELGISVERQVTMVKNAMSGGRAFVGRTLDALGGMLMLSMLIPFYVFLLLLYKPLILKFLFEVFEEHHEENVAEILRETKGAVQSYIVGLMIEASIIAVLNSVALLVLGVKYAILLGVIGAVLNMIPFIGGFIAIILTALIALVTGDNLTTPPLIVVIYFLIQFADNNIIIPRVVSSKVSVNALISILVVLLGGSLWGVAGMFLSIPFVAVLKIIFDRIDELKPWGKLLGDNIPGD